MFTNFFLFGGVVGIIFAGTLGILFAIVMLVYTLARNNLFFTIVEEGQAKVILKFGQFHRAVMSYTDHDFRRDRPDDDFTKESREQFKDPDYWDVLRLAERQERDKHFLDVEKFTPERFSSFFRRLGGLRWVGIPFVHEVRRDRFDWVSNEQTKDGSGNVVDKLVHTEEITDRLLVQEDVYGAEIKGSETKDLVPMDSLLLFTVAVINPRKAISRAQHWLESTINQTRPRYVEYLRTKEYDEVLGGTAVTEQNVMKILDEDEADVPGILKRLREEYGVDVRMVQISKIDPSPHAKVDFTEKGTLNFVAEKEAKATVTRAVAEARRIELVSNEITKQGDIGRLVATLDALKQVDNLTLLSEGSKVVQTLQVGTLEVAPKEKGKGGQ